MIKITKPRDKYYGYVKHAADKPQLITNLSEKDKENLVELENKLKKFDKTPSFRKEEELVNFFIKAFEKQPTNVWYAAQYIMSCEYGYEVP